MGVLSSCGRSSSVAFLAAAALSPLLPRRCAALAARRWGGACAARPARRARVLATAAHPASTASAAASADALRVAAVAGTPAVVPRLREAFASRAAGKTLPPEEQAELVAAGFPYPLDGFQKEAMGALCAAQNVILSAPTGSGKTAVGEMAILLALARDLRVFYTTPLKALSNQKFFDFKKQFGDERVGLLTGDVNLNRDAQIIVMTTEVYRNMLYADGPGRGAGPQALVTDDVFAVCFDEFHYINDPDRGTTWEESVVNSPNHVLLVALSATMSNTGDVRDWFADVQGPTALIESDHRPVPLKFSFCNREGVLPLFDDRGKTSKKREKKRGGSGTGFARVKDEILIGASSGKPKLHPELLASVAGAAGKGRRGRPQRRRSGDDPDSFSSVIREYDRRVSRGKDGGRSRDEMRSRRAAVPSYPFVVRALRRRDMLPSIVFIFSRNGCDQAAIAAAGERECLVSDEEMLELRKRVESFSRDHPDLVVQDRVDLILQGIASHHAGLLPLWKAFVEELFQDGLIKVVFATETLAAGINMPARTTVISTLSRRRGAEGIAKLTTSEVLQMAGRAGRRGKDKIGYSVIMQSPYEGPVEAFRSVTSKVDALRSHFTPSYGMVLNLLQTRSLEDARSLVQRSFGAFLSRKAEESRAKEEAAEASEESTDSIDESVRQGNVVGALEAVAAEAQSLLQAVDEKELLGFIKASERVKAERRALSYLVRQSRLSDVSIIEDTLAFAPPGTRILLRGDRRYEGDARPASKGSMRRRKRRALTAALESAGLGKGSGDLRAHFLEDDDLSIVGNLDDPLDEPGGSRDLIDGVLLDIGPEFGVSVMFAAVGSDNQLHFFTHEHVEQLFAEEAAIDVDAVAPDWQDFEFPERSDWTCIGLDQYVAPLPSVLLPVAQQLASEKTDVDGTVDPPSVSSRGEDERVQHPEVHAQRQRLAYAKSIVRENALFGTPAADLALRSRSTLVQVEGILQDVSDGSKNGKVRSSKRNERKQIVGNVFNRRGSNLISDGVAESMEGLDTGVFAFFMSIVRVAQTYGFVDEEHCVTAIGQVGAKVRADNELWASVALMDPSLENASPVHLAAVVSALLCEGMRADAYIEYQPSTETVELVNNLAPLRTRLLAVQDEAGVPFGVGLDLDHAGLVEAWASGTSWVDMLSNTSLQEGDVCRVLRRTLDLLRQIPHLPFVTDEVRLNAKRAVTLFDRFPVVDERTYVVRASEKSDPHADGDGA